MLAYPGLAQRYSRAILSRYSGLARVDSRLLENWTTRPEFASGLEIERSSVSLDYTHPTALCLVKLSNSDNRVQRRLGEFARSGYPPENLKAENDNQWAEKRTILD